MSETCFLHTALSVDRRKSYEKTNMLNIKEEIEDKQEHANDLKLLRYQERRRLRLGKRLAYILRYGAEKAECRVDDGI